MSVTFEELIRALKRHAPLSVGLSLEPNFLLTIAFPSEDSEGEALVGKMISALKLPEALVEILKVDKTQKLIRPLGKRFLNLGLEASTLANSFNSKTPSKLLKDASEKKEGLGLVEAANSA